MIFFILIELQIVENLKTPLLLQYGKWSKIPYYQIYTWKHALFSGSIKREFFHYNFMDSKIKNSRIISVRTFFAVLIFFRLISKTNWKMISWFAFRPVIPNINFVANWFSVELFNWVIWSFAKYVIFVLNVVDIFV